MTAITAMIPSSAVVMIQREVRRVISSALRDDSGDASDECVGADAADDDPDGDAREGGLLFVLAGNLEITHTAEFTLIA